MVSSRAYPGLERKPGGPDNWVERAGGLPDYIERIAKHLHYERDYSISRAIATAVNTVKRWARGGTVTAHGTTKRITSRTQALAAKAVAEWEAKKKAGKVDLAADRPGECSFCDDAPTHKIVYANGKAVVFTCDADLEKGKELAAKATPPGYPPSMDNIDSVTDLAEPDIADTATMVALMIPPDIANKMAVPGGVPADELHITLGYFGEVEDEEGADEIARMVTECVQEYGENLSGQVGGILAFPPSDQGTPWAATVDIPGLSRLQLKLVEHFRGSDYPIDETHGFTPHVSLTFDDPQDPLEPIPVRFGSVAVARGNELVADVPLEAESSADEPPDGTIPPKVGPTREAKVELSEMLARARSISDPEQKTRVRMKILELSVSAEKREKSAAMGHTITGTTSFPIDNEQDLRNAIQAFGRAKDKAAAKKHIISRARSLGLTRLIPKQWKVDLANAVADSVLDFARGLTKDGRPSFKNQGKWRHGFIPVDDAAVTSKAKGSPIARKRITRLYGGGKTSAPHIRVKSSDTGATTGGTSISRIGKPEIKDASHSQRVNPKARREVSKGGGGTSRALSAWGDVPDEAKTVRNGKRYVLAIYNGRQQLTEWVGPSAGGDVKADPADGLYSSISMAKAVKFSAGQLRRLLAVPGQPEDVKRVLNAALRAAMKKSQTKRSVGVG